MTVLIVYTTSVELNACDALAKSPLSLTVRTAVLIDIILCYCTCRRKRRVFMHPVLKESQGQVVWRQKWDNLVVCDHFIPLFSVNY